MPTRKATQFAALGTGLIIPFGGDVAPTGWLLCDGSEYEKADYQALAGVVEDRFGAGSDADHFKVPDLRGRWPAGFDDMGGIAANRIVSGDKFTPTNGAGEPHYLLVNFVIKT